MQGREGSRWREWHRQGRGAAEGARQRESMLLGPGLGLGSGNHGGPETKARPSLPRPNLPGALWEPEFAPHRLESVWSMGRRACGREMLGTEGRGCGWAGAWLGSTEHPKEGSHQGQGRRRLSESYSGGHFFFFNYGSVGGNDI